MSDELIIVGDYQIYTRDKLGSGGFGKVFKSFNTRSLTTVAVKQISLANKDAKKIKEIQNEIKLLKQLDHYRIVRYKDDIRKGDYLYIMMEYLESGSLGALTRKFKIGEAGISKYIAQVLEGLSFLHGEGIIHRDIKGDNVLLTKDSDVKLADFGVSSKLSRVQTNEICGTPFWMAPEIISLSGATYSSDIWSVGCMVIELLTGKPPYFDLDRMNAFFKIVMDPHPPLPSNISPICEDFLLQCFNKEPSLRKSAEDLLKHPWILQTGTPYTSRSLGIPSITNNTRTSPLRTSRSDRSMSTGSWDSFGNSGRFETVVQVKKEPNQQQQQKQPNIIISNTDKLRAYVESDSDSDDDDILGSDDDNHTLDLRKRMHINMKTISIESDDIFQDDDADLEMNEMKRLEDEVSKIIKTISDDAKDAQILAALEQLNLKTTDDYMYSILIRSFLNENLMGILSLLNRKTPSVVLAAQKLLLCVQQNTQIQEKLLTIGILPALARVVCSWKIPEIREQAITLLHDFVHDDVVNRKMFVASGGIRVLAQLLQTNGFQAQKLARDVIYRTIDIILNIIATSTSLQQRTDLCRLLASQKVPILLSGLIQDMLYLAETEDSDFSDYLSIAQSDRRSYGRTISTMNSRSSTSSNTSSTINSTYFETVMIRKNQHSETERAKEYIEKGLNIMVTFSVCVTMLTVNQNTIENIVSILAKLDPQNKLQTLHFIKNLSTLTDPTMQELVINGGVLQALVRELSVVIKEKEVADPEQIPCKSCVHILNALFMLCCYNTKRKEMIAKAGAISLLKDILFADLPVKNIAMELFLGFTFSSSSETRHEFMIKQDGPKGLFCILGTMNTKAVWPQMVLEALCELLSNNDPHTQQEYEQIIAQPERAKMLIELFTNNNVEQQPWAMSMIPSLCNLLQVSHLLADAFASDSQFIRTVASWLSKEISSTEKTDPRKLKSLLDVLRICLNEKADSNIIPRKLVPREALQAINILAEYTQDKKLALFTIVQELQKKIV